MRNCLYKDCKQTNPQPDENFYKLKRRGGSLKSWCRYCCRAYAILDRNKNRDKITPEQKEKTKQYNITYFKENKLQIKEQRKTYYIDNIDYHKDQRLKKIYGISLKDYENMKIKQNNLCFICNKEETAVFNGKIKRLAVDHCHKTGRVRKLLCQQCNTCVGTVKDDINILKKMIEYLND